LEIPNQVILTRGWSSWPHAVKALSRDVLLKAKAGPDTSPEDQGQVLDRVKDRPVIDWEHTSTNIAKRCGKQTPPLLHTWINW
jgi:hypothetical protein